MLPHAMSWQVLWVYGHCRALVRRRSFGQYQVLPEEIVPPLVFPYKVMERQRNGNVTST